MVSKKYLGFEKSKSFLNDATKQACGVTEGCAESAQAKDGSQAIRLTPVSPCTTESKILRYGDSGRFSVAAGNLFRPYRAFPVRAGYPGLRSFLAFPARPPAIPR